MAGDTRDTPPPKDGSDSTARGPPAGETGPPEHIKSSKPKVYEVFNNPSPSANDLPAGYGQNTAGSRKPIPTLTEAVKTVRVEDLKMVYQYPCARESLLMGIGAGFGVGGVRALWGGWLSCHDGN
jgi:cytochrome c oxidase assembly protein subunit 20